MATTVLALFLVSIWIFAYRNEAIAIWFFLIDIAACYITAIVGVRHVRAWLRVAVSMAIGYASVVVFFRS